MVNTKRFYSKKNYEAFKRRVLHPNRIQKEYTYTEEGTGKTVYAVKYYRDTKKLRKEHNFPETTIM